ncbi:MAG: hypothetical protein V4696_07440 [Pseudomonadota bacterium]
MMARKDGIIQDQNGIPLEGALLYVYSKTTGALANLLDDSGATLSNPVKAGPLGEYYLNTLPGFYRAEYWFRGKRYEIDTDFLVGDAGDAINGPVFYVSTTGDALEDGLSPATAWTLAHALDAANTDLLPGSTVLLIGSSDPDAPTSYFTPNEDGFKPRISGVLGSPITYAVYPGQYAVIDGDVSASLTWTRIVNDVGKQIYETTVAVRTAGNAYSVGGNIKLDGRWFALCPAKGSIGEGVQMNATTHNYLINGEYYPGWMIERITSTGKLRLRLDNPTSAAMLSRTVPGVTSTVPGDNEIAISVDGFGLRIGASHIKWQVPIVNCYTSFACDYTQPRQSHWEFCGTSTNPAYDRPFYRVCNTAAMDDCSMHDWLSEGAIQLDGNLCYMDFKGGATGAENVRKVAIASGEIGSGGIYTSARWHFYRYTLQNFFDGSLGDGTEFEFGKLDDTDPSDTELAWANRCTFTTYDDTFQFYATNQGWYVHDCQFTHAGVSRDGSRSEAARGVDWPVVSRNVMVPVSQIFFGRKDAIDGDGVTPREGICWPSPLSSHGIKTGALEYTFPWTLEGNTIGIRGPSVNTGGPSVATMFFDMNLALTLAGNHQGGQNIIANNIFAVEGDFGLLWLTGRLILGLGREVWTGNIFCTPSGSAVWASGANPMIREVRVAGVDLTDPVDGPGWKDFAAIKANTTALVASQVDYASGLQPIDDTKTTASLTQVVDASSFRPVLAAAKTSGSDVTLLLPDLGAYLPYRGGLAPV